MLPTKVMNKFLLIDAKYFFFAGISAKINRKGGFA